MAESSTVVAALKFKGGVLIGADSQVSDDLAGVRWLCDKPEQIGNHPLVVAFTGSHSRILDAKRALNDGNMRPEQFKSADRVRTKIDAILRPIYQDIKLNSNPPVQHQDRAIALLGITAFWAAGQPHIQDRDINGDYCPHDYFHAMGSGAKTAYAVYYTIGGHGLLDVEEPLATMAMLRVLKTSIQVEMMGVAEPIVLFTITDGKVRRLLDEEISTHVQAVERWETREQEALFAGNL